MRSEFLFNEYIFFILPQGKLVKQRKLEENPSTIGYYIRTGKPYSLEIDSLVIKRGD